MEGRQDRGIDEWYEKFLGGRQVVDQCPGHEAADQQVWDVVDREVVRHDFTSVNGPL